MTGAASPLYLTPKEAGVLLGCSAETVRQMIRHGELRHIRHGVAYKIPRIEVEKLTMQSLEPSDEERDRRAKVKELRRLVAECQRVLAELE